MKKKHQDENKTVHAQLYTPRHTYKGNKEMDGGWEEPDFSLLKWEVRGEQSWGGRVTRTTRMVID